MQWRQVISFIFRRWDITNTKIQTLSIVQPNYWFTIISSTTSTQYPGIVSWHRILLLKTEKSLTEGFIYIHFVHIWIPFIIIIHVIVSPSSCHKHHKPLLSLSYYPCAYGSIIIFGVFIQFNLLQFFVWLFNNTNHAHIVPFFVLPTTLKAAWW